MTAIFEGETPEERHAVVEVCKVYIDLTNLFFGLAAKPSRPFSAALESFVVISAIIVGQAEGKPMTISKISAYTGIPRGSAYRVVDKLGRLGRVRRNGRHYYVGPRRYAISEVRPLVEAVRKLTM